MKLCIFDLDGTLINTINTISYFANRALKKYGLREIPAERYKLLVGDGAKVLVERMLKETGADEALFEEVSREYNQAYDRDYLYLTEPYDGILELLRNLKGLGVKTAVLTNKPDDTAQKRSCIRCSATRLTCASASAKAGRRSPTQRRRWTF